jgi:hypothetical protein
MNRRLTADLLLPARGSAMLLSMLAGWRLLPHHRQGNDSVGLREVRARLVLTFIIRFSGIAVITSGILVMRGSFIVMFAGRTRHF